MKPNNNIWIKAGGILVFIACAVIVLLKTLFFSEKQKTCPDDLMPAQVAEKPKRYLFGFDLDSFEIRTSQVQKGDRFGDILQRLNISPSSIAEIQKLSHSAGFNPRLIKAGATYYVFVRRDTLPKPAYLIYDPGQEAYFLIKLEGKTAVSRILRPVEMRRMEAKGTIETSLYNAFVKNNLNINLAMELSEIFAWTVDFYKVQKGDAFKVIYYEKYVEGKPVGIDHIAAACFYHLGKEYYAFRFEEDGRIQYFDENGQNVKKMFLKAPLKFSRISSRYNLRRFHPVLKRVKAHLGTDYAAPAGTPIMSVGDGTVIEAGYTAGNGNYVKIRHNAVYTTQYLHMSKFARGIRKGKRVAQGEVIGYVGSTGLATGPHLCFRFWKNGRQVDPLREKPMQSQPVKKENLTAFQTVVSKLKPQLDNI